MSFDVTVASLPIDDQREWICS